MNYTKNDIETLVQKRIDEVKEELQVSVAGWVKVRLNQIKNNLQAKKVTLVSGMGTQVLKVDDAFVETDPGSMDHAPFFEIVETLELLAGDNDFYLLQDVSV